MAKSPPKKQARQAAGKSPNLLQKPGASPKQGPTEPPKPPEKQLALFDTREFVREMNFGQMMLEKEVQSLSDMMETLSDSIDTLATKIDQFDDTFRKLNDSIDELAAKVAQLADSDNSSTDAVIERIPRATHRP